MSDAEVRTEETPSPDVGPDSGGVVEDRTAADKAPNGELVPDKSEPAQARLSDTLVH